MPESQRFYSALPPHKRVFGETVTEAIYLAVKEMDEPPLEIWIGQFDREGFEFNFDALHPVADALSVMDLQAGTKPATHLSDKMQEWQDTFFKVLSNLYNWDTADQLSKNLINVPQYLMHNIPDYKDDGSRDHYWGSLLYLYVKAGHVSTIPQ